ncbi:HAD family hydrolase [Legionella waltersii]|uniref:Calcium-transporting ATPase n=1 Tax=Legionella waltersii TaxID=66969 RepID=A0A0W1ABQ4_9GAMM|nr:HAD family hydrolase [Legionella waltersii]KTD78796.1 calcium-transporting ATPase [Legionella waltersii]SNV11101.1 calcium-transporting ATPase [Legionella waltersii]
MRVKPNSTSSPQSDSKQNRALSLQLVRDAQPDRTYYLTNGIMTIGNFVSSRIAELYNTLLLTFSLDSMDWSNFKQYVWPTISSGAALIVGNYLSEAISEYQTGSPEYDFIVKFLFGAAILGYCAIHRITDKKITSQVGLSAAVASEVMGITYMYSSVFTGTGFLLDGHISDEYSLIAGLGASALIVPSTISLLTQKLQDFLVRRQYGLGAQRSDTAAISSGLTLLSNLYFQINHYVASELMVSSRLFQLGLISHNTRYAERIVQKFRNLPALFADLAPSTIKKMVAQQKKLAHDYEYNHIEHRVLRWTSDGAELFSKPRYQLRTGDLVLCDESIDLSCVPLSGELIAFKKDTNDTFTQEVELQQVSVNLKAQNGEDRWIEHKTKPSLDSNYKKIDLHAVKNGKQAGVLVGDKLNLYGSDCVFIQIKPENELVLSSAYEKKAVINDIISERKQRSVLYSILGSIIMAAFLQRDITTMPAETLRLMFTLFQTMIPFSEAFLRETVNSRLMKKLNNNLGEQSFETIDALRVVDLCNALGGYYRDRFPKGVAILSDKTGTLTTNKMNVLGLWTDDQPAEVQDTLKVTQGLLLPTQERWLKTFEVFCNAYTYNSKELEPEEHAMLEFFKSQLEDQDCLNVSIHGHNHLRKTLRIKEEIKEIESFHLGLYRKFGGRFTLVKDGKQYFLVFCGVPKQDAFAGTHLLHSYTSMQSRTEVLSRDWCLGRCTLVEKEFLTLRDMFDQDDKQKIESFLTSNTELLQSLEHHGTFIVDNPVKKGAEKFINQCRDISVPVFVATGDTIKAAENIANVLCPLNSQHIFTIRAEQIEEEAEKKEEKEDEMYPPNSTIIYSGAKEKILQHFETVMEIEPSKRPVIIFAEMSTNDKGALALYLKNHHYFVVANGDGSNDVMMMKNANVVIAHQAEDGSFAPGVDALSNISEEQLRRLFGSEKSFYELFDINLPKSLFVQQFAPLANSQEKPSEALALKSGKMTFDLAKAVGANVTEMNHQHWYSVGFDLLWLWIAFYEINQSADLPMDNRNINVSTLISNSMAIAMFFGVLQAVGNYMCCNESTNLFSMMLILLILPFALRCIFDGFKMVQNNLYPKPEPKIVEIDDSSVETIKSNSVFEYLGTLFSKKKVKQVEGVKDLANTERSNHGLK